MDWIKLKHIKSDRLFEARAQLHQAVQLLTASGISFVTTRPDDSHTAITWNPDLNNMFSQRFGKENAFQLALDPVELSLRIIHGDVTLMQIALNGVTLRQAAFDLQFFLEDQGLPPDVFTMKRHFKLPDYPDRWEIPFDTSDTLAFQTLSSSYSNAFHLIQGIAQADVRASAVLTWPHHFDMATLINLGEGKSIGVGLSPGDESYTAPYYYVNVWPYPSEAQVLDFPLTNGMWHTEGWIGMVLTLEAITTESEEEKQREIVKTFLKEAMLISKSITLK